MKQIKQDSKQGSGNTKDQNFFLEQRGIICNFYKGTGEHGPSPYMTLMIDFIIAVFR